MVTGAWPEQHRALQGLHAAAAVARDDSVAAARTRMAGVQRAEAAHARP